MSELAQLLWQELSQLEQSASLNPWRILDYGLGDAHGSQSQNRSDLFVLHSRSTQTQARPRRPLTSSTDPPRVAAVAIAI